MEINCGIDCFSPELNGSLGFDHHRPGYFIDCRDHSFRNPVFMIGIWTAWLKHSSAGHEDISQRLIVIYSLSIIAPELLDLISH